MNRHETHACHIFSRTKTDAQSERHRARTDGGRSPAGPRTNQMHFNLCFWADDMKSAFSHGFRHTSVSLSDSFQLKLSSKQQATLKLWTPWRCMSINRPADTDGRHAGRRDWETLHDCWSVLAQMHVYVQNIEETPANRIVARVSWSG